MRLDKTYHSFPLILMILATPGSAWAGDKPPTVESNKAAIELVQTHGDDVWTLIAVALVFFIQAGFAMVESGFTRAKNAINIMMKNLMDFSVGMLGFWAVGFGLMFGATSTGWFGFNPGSTTAAVKDISWIFVYTNLAAGLFNIEGVTAKIIGVQLLGIGTAFVWAFGAGLIMFKLIDLVIGLRVSAQEEPDGLDLIEHAGSACPDFQTSTYAQN